MIDQIDPVALVKAALERAARYHTDFLVIKTSLDITEIHYSSDYIRALADDPDVMAGIIEQVKGETDE